MIHEDVRYKPPRAAYYFPLCKYSIDDLDERRTVSVFFPYPGDQPLERSDFNDDLAYQEYYQSHNEILEDLSHQATRVLRKYADSLPLDVVAIHVDKSGNETLSTNPDDDATEGSHYVPLAEFQRPAHVDVVLRSELIEIERFPGADLVSYPSSSGGVKKAVFKYCAAGHPEVVQRMWAEANILMRLPPHPNLLPLQGLVLEERSRTGIVGIMTPFIPGGTLKFPTDKSRVIKLKWMRQLMKVV